MDRYNADGNLIGRIGALACLAAAAVLLARILGLSGACPIASGPGGACLFSVSETSRLPVPAKPAEKP